MTRNDARDTRNAETEFARFDQGPMDDMPAAMPRDSIDDDANDAPDSPIKSTFDPRAESQSHGYRNQQTPDEVFVTPLERNDERADAVSIISEEGDGEPYAPQQIQDRWAQIRENAQRRAAARASEEQSRPSQSARTDDDGATSEEESKSTSSPPPLRVKQLTDFAAIESRVARIKARVAELTGNMDNDSAIRRWETSLMLEDTTHTQDRLHQNRTGNHHDMPSTGNNISFLPSVPWLRTRCGRLLFNFTKTHEHSQSCDSPLSASHNTSSLAFGRLVQISSFFSISFFSFSFSDDTILRFHPLALFLRSILEGSVFASALE
jgi:hypothetical protein